MTLLEFFANWLEERRKERAVIRGHELTVKSMELDFDRESNVCQSCEALKLELAKAHDMNRELLTMIQPKSQEVPKTNEPQEFKPILPNHRSWRVKQQTLEDNDRHNARLINEKVKEELRLQKEREVKPVPEIVVLTEPVTVESIEKELGVINVDESVSAAS